MNKELPAWRSSCNTKIALPTPLKNRNIDEDPIRINLVENAVPQHRQPYRMSKDQDLWLKLYLNRLLEADLIEPSQSSWAAGVVLVPADIDKRITRKRSVIRPAKPLVVKSQYPYGNFVASVESLSQDISPLDVSFYETDVIPPSITVTTIAPEVNGPLASSNDPYRICIEYVSIIVLLTSKRRKLHILFRIYRTFFQRSLDLFGFLLLML
jgi:hypothetical protein